MHEIDGVAEGMDTALQQMEHLLPHEASRHLHTGWRNRGKVIGGAEGVFPAVEPGQDALSKVGVRHMVRVSRNDQQNARRKGHCLQDSEHGLGGRKLTCSIAIANKPKPSGC